MSKLRPPYAERPYASRLSSDYYRILETQIVAETKTSKPYQPQLLYLPRSEPLKHYSETLHSNDISKFSQPKSPLELDTGCLIRFEQELEEALQKASVGPANLEVVKQVTEAMHAPCVEESDLAIFTAIIEDPTQYYDAASVVIEDFYG